MKPTVVAAGCPQHGGLRLRTEAHEPARRSLTLTACLMETDGHMPRHAELVQLIMKVLPQCFRKTQGGRGGAQGCRLTETANTGRVGTRHARHRWRQAQGSGRAPAVEGGGLGARSRWLGHMDRAQRLVESGAVCGTGLGTSLTTRKSGATSDCLSERGTECHSHSGIMSAAGRSQRQAV